MVHMRVCQCRLNADVASPARQVGLPMGVLSRHFGMLLLRC